MQELQLRRQRGGVFAGPLRVPRFDPFVPKLLSSLPLTSRRPLCVRLVPGKSGFVTARDLLKWANRRPHGKEEAAVQGFFLLAERLRKEEDRQEVKEVRLECVVVEIW